MNAVIRRVPGRLPAVVTVCVLALVLAGRLVWVYVLDPRLGIRRIILESDLALSDEQLLGMLDLENQNWAGLDGAEIETILESYPVIRKARAVKIFPDGLRLYVYRRRPLAVALVGGGTDVLPAVFDDEGYAIQIGSGSAPLDLPVISGPSFPNAALGVRLPEAFQGILNDLAELRDNSPRLFALISEIEVIPAGGEAFDLKLYLNHIPVPVLMDREITDEAVRRAVLVLDVLSTGTAGAVREADMRGGQVVFRNGEGA